MAWNPYPALPIGAVRDLLGITRALYRAATETPGSARLQALEGVGRTLQGVLQASREARGTIAHQNAWAAAEHATQALRGLVGEGQLLAPIVDATAKRVSQRRGSMVSP